MSASSPSLPQSESLALAPGAIVGGKYRIDGFLGSGGMGIVLSATHVELDAPVAIKVVRDDFAANEAIVSRLLFEARAVARMQSMHIVRVLDVARLPNGAPYVVMERLRGGDMAVLLEERKAVPVAEAVGYVLQACEGLIEAHSLGIVHRDLKPENLFLAVTPEGIVLKILDFGISKDLGTTIRHGKRTTLTKGGAAIGSPSYMAPEQIRAEPNLDGRADIWSLGTILFELLTGRCPFHGETVPIMYQKVLTEAAPSVRDFLPDAPAELDTIIQLCLQKDPADRFQTVGELALALRNLDSPAPEERKRLESGIELTAQAHALKAGVSLPVKLGLLATAGVLAVASVAFWQLQLRGPEPRDGSRSQLAAPGAARTSAVIRPAPGAAAASSGNPPTMAQPEVPLGKAEIVSGAESPESSAHPSAGRRSPPPYKPAPVSAGVRYGL